MGKLCQKLEKGKQMFEEFWKVYPRKVAKAEARKAWAQTEKIRPSTDALIEAIRAQSQTEQWMRGNGQFIPHPATWLRGERWDDEIEVKLPNVVNEKPWHETWQGIVHKGLELGLKESDFQHPQDFRAAVMRGAMRAA